MGLLFDLQLLPTWVAGVVRVDVEVSLGLIVQIPDLGGGLDWLRVRLQSHVPRLTVELAEHHFSTGGGLLLRYQGLFVQSIRGELVEALLPCELLRCPRRRETAFTRQGVAAKLACCPHRVVGGSRRRQLGLLLYVLH